MSNLTSKTLVFLAVIGLLAACGGGGGGGGTPPVEVDPPVITVQPADAEVLEGETASFSVTATGEGTLSYQWQLSTSGGASWSSVGGATGNSYTTPATALADDGNQYRCTVSNAGGSTQSDAATLSVDPVPPYSHTIVIDGINDFTSDELFDTTGPGGLAWVAWDADYVYVAIDSPVIVEASADDWFTVYLGGSGGTTTGVAYGPQQPALPFSAAYHIRWRADNGLTEALAYGAGSWSDAGWNFTNDYAFEGTFFEMRIPIADIGDPSTLPVHLSLVRDVLADERTELGVPSTSFVSGFDPNYTAWFAFDLLGVPVPSSYLPMP